MWATDVSPAALAVARANLAAVGPRPPPGCTWPRGCGTKRCPPALRGRLRVIVSNPPYVTEAEFAGLPAEVRDHEPTRRAGGRPDRPGEPRAPGGRRARLAGAGRGAGPGAGPRPGRRPCGRRPRRPATRPWPSTGTWPAGTGCWWPAEPGRMQRMIYPADPLGAEGREAAQKALASGLCRGHPDRHRLRAGRRPVRARAPPTGCSSWSNGPGTRTCPSSWPRCGRPSTSPPPCPTAPAG